MDPVRSIHILCHETMEENKWSLPDVYLLRVEEGPRQRAKKRAGDRNLMYLGEDQKK